jgi:hypothetical protein
MPCTDGKTKKRRNPRHNNGGFSPGKKTLAEAEEKSVDCRRFGDPIDKLNAPRRSPRRDERSGTLGFGRRCTIGSNCSPDLSPELEPPRTSASNTGS